MMGIHFTLIIIKENEKVDFQILSEPILIKLDVYKEKYFLWDNLYILHKGYTNEKKLFLE